MRVGLGKQSQHRFQPLFRDEIVEGPGQIGTIATQLIVVGALCRGWRSESVEIKCIFCSSTVAGALWDWKKIVHGDGLIKEVDSLSLTQSTIILANCTDWFPFSADSTHNYALGTCARF
jgi:hypothetical protein